MASWIWTDIKPGTPTDPTSINAMGQQLQKLSQRFAAIDIFNSIGGCTLSTTSGTYVDITGGSKAFTKYGNATDSDLIVQVCVSGYVSVAATVVKIGLRVNGVDYDVSIMPINAANSHAPWPTGSVRITNLPNNVYTLQLRALKVSGTGTITIDNNDTVSMTIQEVSN